MNKNLEPDAIAAWEKEKQWLRSQHPNPDNAREPSRVEFAAMSVAISLKRIADTLDRIDKRQSKAARKTGEDPAT